MHLKSKKRRKLYLFFVFVLSFGAGIQCFDGGGDGGEKDPVAHGRIDNQTAYYLNDVIIAGKNFGIIEPNTLTEYTEIPIAGGKLYFTLITDTSTTCESEYLEAPDVDRRYTITFTSGGLSCYNFNYTVNEDE